MKKKIFIAVMLCCLFLNGCADRKNKSNELKVMDLSGLPSVEIIGAKDGELPVQFPDQEQITETKGMIAGYAVTDEGAYYIVSYDNRYRGDACRQYAIYKQSFGSSELLLLAEKLYDEGRYVTFAGTEHGEFVWYQVNEREDTMYKCRLENSSVVEDALEGKEGESPWGTMDRELEAEFEGWEQEIPEEYLTGRIYLTGQNERYTVFVQMLEHPYVEGKITDSYINVYDRKSGVMKQLRMEDYGSVCAPALSGNYIMFLTIDDVMSYDAEDDSYENVYMVQLDTMEVHRITDNSGKETTNAEVLYGMPYASEGYLYFMARDGEDYSYQYLYYMKTASESEEVTTELSSTGYPTGQLQREYVYVEGTLYQSAFEIVELPQNAEKVGEVSKIDNEKYPDENFEASYLEIGTPIYKSGDMVYIEDSEGTHRRYEPVEELE